MMGLIPENVWVEGIPLQKILSLEIDHRPNEHGRAVLTAEGEIPVLKRFIERETDGGDYHKIPDAKAGSCVVPGVHYPDSLGYESRLW